MLEKYVKNTHASTHNLYKLKIEAIFKISRHGEEGRFEKFKSLDNRTLLWHGSRTTNYAGILSQVSTEWFINSETWVGLTRNMSVPFCCLSAQPPL